MARWMLLAAAATLACASAPETVPRASGEQTSADGRRAPLALRSGQVLRIAFVRVAGGAVSGTLDPYTDPDCKCTVQTTFTGTLRGTTIEGTFVTRGSQLPNEQSGRWRVTRTAQMRNEE